VYYSPTNAQVIVLKTTLKFTEPGNDSLIQSTPEQCDTHTHTSARTWPIYAATSPM